MKRLASACLALLLNCAPLMQVKDVGEQQLTVLNVYGTPYQMGYAQGERLGPQVREAMGNFVEITRAALREAKLDDVAVLDDAYAQLAPHIPESYHEEMKGIADGSGLDLKILQWAHAIPEIKENSCSGYALMNGTAVQGTYHVRLLDYGMNLEVQKHPVVIIYHPNDGNEYANFTWAGFIGSVGGVNEKGLALGEIGGGKAITGDPERMDGIPFYFLFRDVLKDAKNVQEAQEMVKNARRTQHYVYVFSDRNTASVINTGPKTFDIATTGQVCSTFQKKKQQPAIENVVYFGEYQDKLYNNLVTEIANDKYTLDEIFTTNKNVAMQDNLQAWVFRHDTLEAWLANAKGTTGRAVDQEYVRINLRQYFDP